jgi:chromosome segregation ATPase
MPQATKKDASKQLQANLAEVKKEQKQWEITKVSLEREVTSLTAKVTDLEERHAEAEDLLTTVRKELEAERLRLSSLKAKNNDLERDNHSLESDIDHGRHEVEKLAQQLKDREATFDSELGEYELGRKQEIKQRLLEANKELSDVLAELQEARSQHQESADNLRDLQAVYKQEQTELQDSNKATEAALAANKQRVEASETRISTLEAEIKDLLYKRDTASSDLKKIKEQHDKFVTYEREARKVLDTKDKQLQAREAELNTQGQFLRNSRSFLPEL